MSTFLDTPSCIHVPRLLSGKAAMVSWSEVESAVGYELECVFDSTFDSQGFGETWLGLEREDSSWADVSDILTWGNAEDNRHIVSYIGTGSIVDTTYEPGVAHISHSIDIPDEVSSACFRVRAYSRDEHSPYIVSEVISISTSDFDADDSVELPVTAGENYFVQTNARDIKDFEEAVLSLEYPSPLLSLDEIYLEAPNAKTDMLAVTYEETVEEVSNMAGKYEFRCIKDIADETSVTGLVVCFRFTALSSGTASVSLSRRTT